MSGLMEIEHLRVSKKGNIACQVVWIPKKRNCMSVSISIPSHPSCNLTFFEIPPCPISIKFKIALGRVVQIKKRGGRNPLV